MHTTLFCGLVWLLLLLSVQGQLTAQRKCNEFRQKIIKQTSVIPLTLNPTPINLGSFCTKTVDLIVGREDATPGEFPHEALLGYLKVDTSKKYEYDFLCGGSLISERYVLTAADCMKYRTPKIVRLGEHNLKHDYGNQVDFNITNITRHPAHRYGRPYHDIALVELAENVRFSNVIRPACLWTGFALNITSVVATGFGLTENDGETGGILQKVMLDILDKQECAAQYKNQRGSTKHNGIKDGQLCVGSLVNGKDTCIGDFGDPIQVVTEPKGCLYHIIGVTSLGPSVCGMGRSPTIYTRVASYITWIEKQVWPNGW